MNQRYSANGIHSVQFLQTTYCNSYEIVIDVIIQTDN